MVAIDVVGSNHLDNDSNILFILVVKGCGIKLAD